MFLHHRFLVRVPGDGRRIGIHHLTDDRSGRRGEGEITSGEEGQNRS
ncbi:hypothetical protein [Nocardia abscessus]|nr:hypothetical protein [Nocardia abscessus]